MNVTIGNIEHAALTMAGFESFLSNDTNHDSAYMKTTLRLNGVDLDAISGNEGFVSAVKAGGTKIYEMIASLLAQIKKFFFGIFGSRRAKAVETMVSSVASAKKEIKFEFKSTYNPSPSLTASIEKATAGIERLNKLMSKEHFAINFSRYAKFVDDYGRASSHASSIHTWVRNIPQCKVTDMFFGTEELRPLITKLVTTARSKGESYDLNPGTIIKSVDDAEELTKCLENIYTATRKTLSVVTADLEYNNNAYKKLLTFEDNDLKERGKALQQLSTAMVKVENILTSLSTACEEEISKIHTGIQGIKKTLLNKAQDESSEKANDELQEIHQQTNIQVK